MEDFLLIVILIVLAIRWFVLSARMEELQRRIGTLEQTIGRFEAERAPAVTPPPLPQPEPVRAGPPPLPSPLPQAVPPPPPLAPQPSVPHFAAPGPQPELAAPAMPPPLPPMPPPPIFVAPTPAGPTLTQRLREKMQGEEWESIVGGSWLNKLGVLILVIGVALLIGVSFTRIGPAGRISIGLVVSLSMLAGGWVLEKRARYRIFSFGLLGGGWAALYFTTYAMKAIDAARIILNPVLGGLLLLAAAAGMILHSLKYHSQTVTGLTYFIAFATLGPWITPATTLAVIALIPLAASLLYVSYRFAWSELAVFGIVATYGTCASRGDSGAPLASAQIVFTIYWLLFETFDLFRAARRSTRAAGQAILPLNALAFAGLSYAKWSSAAPHYLYALAAGIAAAYLLSTVIRTSVRPPSSFAPESGTFDRVLGGGYQGPITLTAILTAAALLLRFHGRWASTGLLIEAETLFAAGMLFREAYPRRLAAALFATFTGKLLILDLGTSGAVNFAGHNFKPWTPNAALAALLFYVNRALRTTNKAYGFAASAMVALIIGFETPQQFLGLAWFLFAAVLFAFGWMRRLHDFRIQSYSIAAIAAIAIAVRLSTPSPDPWFTLASAAALLYGAVLFALRSPADRFRDEERNTLRTVASWSAVVALVALVWRLVPGDYLGLAWMALALPVLELGLRRWPPDSRVQSYAVGILGALRVLFFNVIPVRNDAPLHGRLLIAGAAALAYLIAARTRSADSESAESVLVPTQVSSAVGTLFALTALWALLPTIAVAPAWATLALLLLETGIAIDLPGLRVQAHIAAAATVARLFFANFDVFGATAGISHRLISVLPVIVGHYYEWSRQRDFTARLRQFERALPRAYLYTAAALMVVLLRFELGRALAVVGWSAFALILIAIGERWKNVDLRRQSYVIAALAFLRSWTTDFWSPGGLEGHTGRIATGAFVVACLFVSQFLIPQPRRARLYYSLLATVLLTILLYHEVSGRLLTMAWGAEGVALLTAGFPLRDRALRLSGLTLFFVCISKLFAYDLEQLETMYRILSFIVLGLIMVSVSWVYTRFRDRVQRFL